MNPGDLSLVLPCLFALLSSIEKNSWLISILLSDHVFTHIGVGVRESKAHASASKATLESLLTRSGYVIVLNRLVMFHWGATLQHVHSLGDVWSQRPVALF